MISSDSGGLLRWEVEVRTGIARQFRSCFTDYRNQIGWSINWTSWSGNWCATDKGLDRKFEFHSINWPPFTSMVSPTT
jgi:hypothetical protein